MKTKLLILIFIFNLTGCSNETSIDHEIVGLWRATIDKKQLLEFGMKKEDIETSATEIKFNKNGVLEIRIIDPVNFKLGEINQLLGMYKVEDDTLEISLDNKIWESQKLVINGDSMSLEATGNNESIINKRCKIFR